MSERAEHEQWERWAQQAIQTQLMQVFVHGMRKLTEDEAEAVVANAVKIANGMMAVAGPRVRMRRVQ